MVRHKSNIYNGMQVDKAAIVGETIDSPLNSVNAQHIDVADEEVRMTSGQAGAEGYRAAGGAVAASLRGTGDHGPAHARFTAGGVEVSRRARRAANKRLIRSVKDGSDQNLFVPPCDGRD